MSGGRGGFTLIELLVAISVLAIVAVLGWRGLDSIIRARVALNSDLQQTRGLQLAFAQMQSDFDHIVTAGTIGGKPTLDAHAGRVALIRTVFAENQPSRAQVVAYRLDNGTLTRRESLATRDVRELDTAWKAAIGSGEIGPAVALQGGIEEMPIRLWTANTGWAVAAGSAPVVPAPPGGVPIGGNTPTGVEVALRLRERSASLIKVFLLGAA